MYRRLAVGRPEGANILELACGSGRILISLLTGGFNLTGVDLSPQMLSMAAGRLAKLSSETQQRATLLMGDIRHLDQVLPAGQQFDLVILGFNSFQHMETRPDQLACLNAARCALKPGGRFIISVINPEPPGTTPASGRSEYWGTFSDPERGSQVILMVSLTDFPDAQQRLRRHYFYEKLPDGTTNTYVSGLLLHNVYPAELQTLLQTAGFKVDKLYGSYALDDFHENSSHIIYACRI